MHLTPPPPIYCGFLKSKWGVVYCMRSIVGWGIASYYLTPQYRLGDYCLLY